MYIKGIFGALKAFKRLRQACAIKAAIFVQNIKIYPILRYFVWSKEAHHLTSQLQEVQMNLTLHSRENFYEKLFWQRDFICCWNKKGKPALGINMNNSNLYHTHPNETILEVVDFKTIIWMISNYSEKPSNWSSLWEWHTWSAFLLTGWIRCLFVTILPAQHLNPWHLKHLGYQGRFSGVKMSKLLACSLQHNLSLFADGKGLKAETWQSGELFCQTALRNKKSKSPMLSFECWAM